MDLPNAGDIGLNNSIFDDYQSIYLNETPVLAKWAFYPMYKESQTDGILYWRIGFDGTTDELVTEHGYYATSNGKRGKYQVDRLKLYVNNLHKNILSKALQDANRGYQDKFKEGYSDETGKSTQLPLAQTANKYPLSGQSGTNPLKSYNFNRGISLQAKIDGIRARVFKNNGILTIYSREGNVHPWLDTYIKPELEILLKYFPSDIGLDCELYNPAFPFEEITSIVKTYKTKHPKNNEIYCYVFDIIVLNTSYDKRYEMLRNTVDKLQSESKFERVLILDHVIIYDEKIIPQYHDAFVREGYEGMMIRKMIGLGYDKKLSNKEIEETWYKPGRNNNLLKVKKFIDEEGIVIDIGSGEGREKDVAMIFIQDVRNNKIWVRPRGSFENRRLWLVNKDKYIGKKYTYRYFELSEEGVPRFPVGVAFRDYE